MSSIRAMFGDASGLYNLYDSRSKAYVKLDVGAGDEINLDDDEFMIAFQYSSESTGRTDFRAYSDIEYLVDTRNAV